MANLSFTYDQQIIRDLYDTAAEAVAASKSLGCDGYRTYLINGITKYVPCSSYVQYENALRWRTAQGVIGAYGSQDNFGRKLIGYQFANAKDEIQGDPYFTMGNFNIVTSPKNTVSQNQSAPITNDAVRKYTITDIANRNLSYFSGKPYVEAVQSLITNNLSVKVLFDPKKLDNYVLYSSLTERFKNTLLEIFNQYPAAMKSTAISIYRPNITQYSYITNENRSQFKISLYGLSNPFGIEFINSGSTLADYDTTAIYRNFAKYYSDYVIYYNGVEYPIVTATLPNSPTDTTTGINVLVNGNPFGSLLNVNNESNTTFYIKPNQSLFDQFKANLSDLASFLLTYDDNQGQYKSDFVFPTVSDNGMVVNTKQTVYFPMYDDVNVDLFTSAFDDYTTTLNDIASSYDSAKTNLIARFLTTDSLQEFDTEDRKVNLIFQLYGKQFDEIRKYIDGITFMRNVSYDKIENVPDLLLKNFAHMLGFETYELEDENTLIDSLFSQNLVNDGTTPAEIDIEIWRRMVINAAYLFKSKGTRKSIEFILKLVGFPDEIFELNEYVYVAEKPVNVPDTLNKIYNNSTDDPTTLLNLQPFDINGYPTVPNTIPYQANGGVAITDKYNVGPFDFGQTYINAYKKSGSVRIFELERTVDDKKSWPLITGTTELTHDDINGYTDYYSDDSRLTINSKEFEAYIGADRVLDASIYRQYSRNLMMVNADLNFRNSLSFNSSTVSFNQFLRECVNNFINPQNRKTISTYPTLTKIYLDYYSGTTNPMDVGRSLAFLGNFDSQWIKLIQQFIPATTVYNAGNKIQNSTFNDNKFKYKYGLNTTVNWLGTDGSEFQDTATKPVYEGSNKILPKEGNIYESITADLHSYQLSSTQGDKLIGQLYGNERYLGSYYSITDFCDESEGRYYIWASGVNYGNDTIYSGNTNLMGSPKYGVFVIYDNEVYRLNTKYLFNSLSYSGITTTGGTRGLPPNQATDTYSGVTKNLWDNIPYITDTRIIAFQDSYTGITGTERSFYMNSIGAAQAFIEIGLSYDCPPPKPHVCYYDYSGETISLTGYTGTTLVGYTDSTGASLYIRQPKYFGYSKNRTLTRPNNLSRGTFNNWTTDYMKIFNYSSGQTYYFGEYIGMVNSSDPSLLVSTSVSGDSNLYLVTSATIYTTGSTLASMTGVTLVSAIGSNGEPSTTTGVTGGLYGRYEERTVTDPLMQVNTAFIDSFTLDPNADKLSINLTKSLNLVHIFSGATPATTYRVTNNIVNNQLFMSDNIDLTFDGFYPVNTNNVGPFYTENTDSTFLHTLQDSLTLAVNTNNYVSIQSLNSNFTTVGDDLTLIATTPGYYLVTKTNLLTINLKLYFESQYNISQTVKVQLIGANQVLYDEQMFTFSGDDLADDRQFYYTFQGFFKAGDKIYLNIIPTTVSCTLSRYETINYNNTYSSVFDPLNDPRFRVLFNSGTVINKYGYYEDGFSIKPIYNQADLSTHTLTINSGQYNDSVVNTPNVLYSLDTSKLVNKLYLDYFKKYTTGSLQYDTTSYDNLLGNDKVDFTFTIRSKKINSATSSLSLSTTTSVSPGVNGYTVSYDFSYNDYFLGNTPKQTELSNINNAISINKTATRRNIISDRKINYVPKYSFFDGVALGTGNTLQYQDFITYNDGLTDFNYIDLSADILTQIRLNRRYYTGILNTTGSTTFSYYAKDNQIISSEIYQNILNQVPEFNSSIINYELNDVVKVLITQTPVVVTTSTGTTIVNEDEYKLYVCINEINGNYHCYQDTTTSTPTIGQIHEIYRPGGSRSCFIELEKYNPANFTPWGYEERIVNGIPNPNVIDYVYKNVLSYSSTGSSTPYQFGDIVLASYNGNNEFFRYIYPRSTVYDPTKTYNQGDWVMSGVTEGSTLYYRYFFVNNFTGATSGTSLTDTTHWTKLTSELFDHRSLAGSGSTYGGATFIGASGATALYSSGGTSWIGYVEWAATRNFSSTVARFPKTLPVNGATPYIATTTGAITGYTSDSTRWNDLLLPNHIFIDRTYDYLDNYEVINQNKILINNGAFVVATGGTSTYTNPKGFYSGSTTGMPFSGYTTNQYSENTNYPDKYGISRNGYTNIYLKPATPSNAYKTGPATFTTNSYFVRPYEGEALGLMPLFERLGRENERNNPVLFITPNLTNFDNSSLFHSKKYAVSRGTLFKYTNTTPVVVASGVTDPALDTTNWTEKDFCLVNNFTFYKDRTRVEVFESTITTLTESVLNNLYFYNNALNLKPGFTSTSFSGVTTDAQLVSALNNFYDVKDSNRRVVTEYGNFDFTTNGTDIIMNYYYPKDTVGYPVTGEFLGKLTATNPCGHIATTIFGMLFNTDLGKLNRGSTLTITPIIYTGAVTANLYTVRVIVNQSANASTNVSVLTADVNLQPITQNFVVNKYTTFSKKFNVIPQTDLELTISYNTTRKQTMFKSGSVDNLAIFVNDAPISTNYIETTLTTNGSIETRTITLKNITANSTININLTGGENVTTDLVQAQNTFNVKNINIKTTQL